VGNAYLEAHTPERLHIIAGPEFGTREGNMLIINDAIYGLKSTGLRWWKKCIVILSEMGYKPFRAEDDISMRKLGSIYEYFARYVEELEIPSKYTNSNSKDQNPLHTTLGQISIDTRMELYVWQQENILKECLVPMSLCLVLNPNKQ